MRRKRRAAWSNFRILYEELEEPEVNPLELDHFAPHAPAAAPGAGRPEGEFALGAGHSCGSGGGAS
jgi:hypothetical protein